MSAKNEHGLTHQQERFAQEVVKGVTLAEAYRVAYPKSQKWAESAVWTQSSLLASNSKVSDRIKVLAQKVEQTFAVDTAKLLQEAHRLAHSSVVHIMHPDGKVKLPHELDPDTAAAVASFKIDEYGRIEYKFWDKNSAIERLFKHKGLFKEDNDQAKPVVFTEIRLVPLQPDPKPDESDK
ncbi:MAG TPA: terminase small subunit [Acidovorax sp.]